MSTPQQLLIHPDEVDCQHEEGPKQLSTTNYGYKNQVTSQTIKSDVQFVAGILLNSVSKTKCSAMKYRLSTQRAESLYTAALAQTVAQHNNG